MCKKRADGTWRYCPGRQPGARTEQRTETRTLQSRQIDAYAKALPAPDSARVSTFMTPEHVSDVANEWLAEATNEDRASLRNYTRYTDAIVNKYLRRNKGIVGDDADTINVTQMTWDEDDFEAGETSTSLSGTIAALDTATANAPALPEPTPVYRGVSAPDGVDPHEWATGRFTPGANVAWSGFSSTSLDPMVAQGFTRGHGVVFEIVTRQGAYLDAISEFGMDAGGEQEILLRRGSRFKVVGVGRGPITGDADFYDGAGSDDVTFVQMVEVEDDPDE